MSYRVGSHYEIHVYEIATRVSGWSKDRAVATASTPADAQRIVVALNRYEQQTEDPLGDTDDEDAW